MTDTPLGLGVVGAGRFARFVLSAAAGVAAVRVVAVTDAVPGRAAELATIHGADAVAGLPALLADDRVEAVVVATPPDSHAPLALEALAAGRHVFCEKPVALTEPDADDVRAAVLAGGRAFVVDHVLRYNPLLAALCRLREAGLLGAVRRLAVENDAADEDLPPRHWFWDEAVSGGILLEHGVHFFDAAAMLIGAPALRVQALGGARDDGRTDTVVCSVTHAGGAVASYAHGFSHPHRAERQLVRVDFGLAEARLYGWIPVRADLDMWAGDVATEALERLPPRTAELLAVSGVRPSGHERIDVTVERDAAAPVTRSRDVAHRAPHHVHARLDLGGPEAKQRVYTEGVRGALTDLAASARTGSTPRASIEAGCAAVRIASAGTRALRDGCTHPVPPEEAA
jgi:predicted dehydrogenase